jgi:hypothetical protein
MHHDFSLLSPDVEILKDLEPEHEQDDDKARVLRVSDAPIALKFYTDAEAHFYVATE